MAERIRVFNQTGGISFQPIPDANTSFLTITPVRTAQYFREGTTVGGTNEAGRLRALYAHMPVTGVHIQQSVDMSIAKTLNADFLVSEFGDAPVQIMLQGVNFYGNVVCSGGSMQHKQIMDFYEANKLSANIKNRIDISITPSVSPKSGVFRCVLFKLKTQTPIKEGQGIIPAYTYELDLIGVRR